LRIENVIYVILWKMNTIFTWVQFIYQP